MMNPYKNQYKTEYPRSKESKKNQGKLHKHGFICSYLQKYLNK